MNIIVAVETTDEPRVSPDARARVTILNASFITVTLCFGFMEAPDVPTAMAELKIPGVTFNPADTSYFLGRRTVLPTRDHGPRRPRDLLFIALNRNSADPSEVFAIPPGRVVELGVQVAV
jgi:KUP system potassium uptake protein